MTDTLILTKATERKIMFSVIFLIVNSTMGIDIHVATLPAIMKYLNTDKAHVQHLVPIYLLGLGLSALVYGPLSDKLGRKPVVLLGLSIASLACFASSLAENINFLIVTRFFQGAGCGVCLVLGRTIFADVFSGEKMAIAIAQIAMFTVLSPIFAPTIGGYIQHIWDWQANFRFLGGFILLSAIVYFFLCPETNKHKNPDAMKPAVINAHYQEILANKLFLNTTLLSGLVASINMVYQALSPFIFQLEFHLSPVFYGWIAGFIGAVGFSARMISVHMLKTYGRIFQLKANTFLLLFGSLLMFAFQQSGYLNMYGIIGFIATMIFTQTSLAPVLSSYALKIFPEKAGVAGSIYSSGQMLVSFAISAIASSFTTNGVYILSMTFLILAIVVGRFTLKLLKTDIM